MPSNNTSSKQKRSEAVILQSLLHLSAREYRKTLSRLREHLAVVDRKASLNQWNDINYIMYHLRRILNIVMPFKT